MSYAFACLSIYFLFVPIKGELHGSRNLMHLITAVFSAARRLPDTVDDQFLFMKHVSLSSKLYSKAVIIKEIRKKYFQRIICTQVICNNCKTHTLTNGTKCIRDTWISYTGRHKTKCLYLLVHGEVEINM